MDGIRRLLAYPYRSRLAWEKKRLLCIVRLRVGHIHLARGKLHYSGSSLVCWRLRFRTPDLGAELNKEGELAGSPSLVLQVKNIRIGIDDANSYRFPVC